ncbi:MAG: hypothetical protein LBL13_08120 [Bacteroidales bacterium]|jgi:hypothetical protein|nr:hypothetical protein [Bacteroidales bacterium]
MNTLTGNKAALSIFRSIDINALTGNTQKPDRAKYNNKSFTNLKKLFSFLHLSRINGRLIIKKGLPLFYRAAQIKNVFKYKTQNNNENSFNRVCKFCVSYQLTQNFTYSSIRH